MGEIGWSAAASSASAAAFTLGPADTCARTEPPAIAFVKTALLPLMSQRLV